MLWPVEPSLMGYERVFENARVWTGYRNTLFLATVGTLLTMTMMVLLLRARVQHEGLLRLL